MAINQNVSVGLTLTDTVYCANDAAASLLGGTPAGGTYLGAGVLGGVFDPTIVGPGTYEIQYLVTDVNGCNGIATDTVVVDACIGIDEVPSLATIKLYPNPTEGQFILDISNGNMEHMNIEIVTVDGRRVFEMNNQYAVGSYQQSFNLTHLAKGVYYVRLVSGEEVAVKRLVIQ